MVPRILGLRPAGEGPIVADLCGAVPLFSGLRGNEVRHVRTYAALW